MGDKIQNKMQMLVDKENMVVKFKTTGDLWDWLHNTKIDTTHLGYNVIRYAEDEEVHQFYYESHLNKFIENYKNYVDEVVVVLNNSEFYLLVTFDGLNIKSIYPFAGDKASETAEFFFEQFTGVSYQEYAARRREGEDNNEILAEDEEGSEIFVLQPNYCLAALTPETILSEGVAKWDYKK
ncbi:hypothetical protein D3C74_91380 [compost metagenome]